MDGNTPELALIRPYETGAVLARFIEECLALVEVHWSATLDDESVWDREELCRAGKDSSFELVTILRQRLRTTPIDDPARPHWALLLEWAERVYGDFILVESWYDQAFKHSELLFGTDLSSARDFLLDRDEAPFWLRHMAYARDQLTALFSDHRYLTDRIGAPPPE